MRGIIIKMAGYKNKKEQKQSKNQIKFPIVNKILTTKRRKLYNQSN